MSHEPTAEELEAARYVLHWYDTDHTPAALTAANSLRDRRIRNEALEEAAALFVGPKGGANWWIAEIILSLKDKEPVNE